MPNPTDYTVGWMCAVGKELVAARNFLDETHDSPDHIPVNDNNAYTLGRLGRHNIVIAALPHQQYGLVSAATVARDMVRSFPNVRIGLMVGIGGGAPSAKHDVRLGDIVVSSPGHGNGGVFQYDYGRTIQDKSFTTTGTLNQPPMFMLTALAALEAGYESDGHNIDAAIKTILEKKSRLRSKYCRPDPAADRLYESHWKHVGSGLDTCEAVCGIDNQRPRPERSDDEDNPKIHYGLIASANQLMKDASIRDKLSADKDVLCFEMEAAGLMNHFPCLVVRGICDYADTHKNDIWQGYAAMAAAAYARDLLYKIAPNKVEAERRLGEVLLNVQKDVKKVKIEVEDLKADAHLDHISKWLAPPDPSSNRNNALRLRHPGSGKWFLNHAAYTDWKFENSFLWLHGIPGCGKTILSSTIIEDLARGEFNQGLLYFHFDFSDTRKQKFDMMLRSLIGQLYDKNKDVRGRLDSLYSTCNQGKEQPSLECLQATFIDMAQGVKGIWIVLDALDECTIRDEYPTGGLLSWTRSLQTSQANVHLLVTSRPEQDIEASIKGWARNQDIIPIQNDLVREDIGAYVHARVREHGILSKRFRLVACQLDELEKCLGPPEVRQALARLPNTLDETYARILASLPSEYLPTATRLLQFLSYSERPLSLEEAVDCIAVDTNTQRFDPDDRIPVPEEISRYCSSLVIIVEKACTNENPFIRKETAAMKIKTEIRLAHYSVKEYLVSNRLPPTISGDLDMKLARESIAKVCLIYLLRDPNDSPDRQLYPLARYAAQYWASHAVASNNSKLLVKLMVDFFNCQKAFETCYRLYPIDRAITGDYLEVDAPSNLYYAAFTGLSEVIQTLLNNGTDVNVRGGSFGNALRAASLEGHKNIVQILLNNGADVNAWETRDGNALQAASYKGHESIVHLLLNNGADVNARGGSIGNALYIASREGHENIVRLLLSNGADVSARRTWDGSALQAASDRGHEHVVQILLNNGANANAHAENTYFGHALQAASHRGYENIVQILLNNGADVNAHAPGTYFGNALQAASHEGHENIVRLLLNNGATVNTHDKGTHFRNAPQAASHQGHKNIVQLLLDHIVGRNCTKGALEFALMRFGLQSKTYSC
ncbi:hypothetical protein CHU98_g3117 [Xylaria longipes]|nr:hypothetical protein CHU98_g3117 [Xylaria longipes]